MLFMRLNCTVVKEQINKNYLFFTCIVASSEYKLHKGLDALTIKFNRKLDTSTELNYLQTQPLCQLDA